MNRRVDRGCEPLHIVNGNVALASLDGTYVGAMQAGFFGEFFLRDTQGTPTTAQIVTENLPDISLAAHRVTLDNVMSLRLQT